jgi:1-acyl-sn-glycerol-3-phosphate acyltransferase
VRQWRHLLQIMFFLCIVKPLMVLFIGLRVRGAENLPESDPFLLIANHTSHLDTAALMNLFPLGRLRNIRPVAAADYFSTGPLISWFSHTFFNILPILRQDIPKDLPPEAHPIEVLKRELQAGRSLIFFPEGTRGSGEEMGEFRQGVGYLVEQVPDLIVCPAYLVNLGRSLPKGEFLPVPFFCEVRLGPPLHPQGTRQEILASLKQAILDLKDAG